MSSYVRPIISDASVFFTVCLAHRTSDLLVQHVDTLRAAVRKVKAKHPFEIAAWVVVPDHMHAIWRLPPGDRNYGQRWGAIKSEFSRRVLRKHGWPKSLVELDRAVHTLRDSHIKRREIGLWQRRFWEHHIRDADDFDARLQYCWGNPVRHGLVRRPADWPYSSIHREIHAGRVDPGWCGTASYLNAGEP